MAAIAFFHRKTLATKKHPEMKELDKRSRKGVEILSILLRLAEVLDRSHIRAVKHVRMRAARKDSLILEINCGRDCQLELWGVQGQLKAAQEDLDREIQINVVGGKRPERPLRSPQPSPSSSP